MSTRTDIARVAVAALLIGASVAYATPAEAAGATRIRNNPFSNGNVKVWAHRDCTGHSAPLYPGARTKGFHSFKVYSPNGAYHHRYRDGVWTDVRWVPGHACRKFRVGEFNEVAVR